MADIYVKRPVVVVSLPMAEGLEITRHEDLVIQYPGSPKLDIGCICYLKRRFGGIYKNKMPTATEVVMDSLSNERIRLLKTMLPVFNDEVGGGARRGITAYWSAYYTRSFFDWCDANGQLVDDYSRECIEIAFRNFVEHLRHLVQTNARKVNSSVKKQRGVLVTFRTLFSADDFGKGINLLVGSSAEYRQTPVPHEADQSKALAWLRAIFHGFSDLVLENAEYPFKLRVPRYLKWPDDSMWVYPCQPYALPPGSTTKNLTVTRGSNKEARPGVCYDEGRLGTYAELAAAYQGTAAARRGKASRVFNEVTAQLDEANSDLRHPQRLLRAMNAMSAFIGLFIAETGMNPSEVFKLPWSEGLADAIHDPVVERQGFREIKYRAGGRIVAFEIGATFLADLRKFSRLRAYLLGIESCETMFFSLSSVSGWKAVPVKANRTIYRTIQRFDPSIRLIAPSGWRAAKQDWAIRNTDPATAARLLQHSESTALRYYSSGSQTTHQLEMGEFFSHVDNILLEKDVVAPGQETSIGLCISPDRPMSVTKGLGVTPKCGKPEGCLFCDKFRVHADEPDIRKLMSCRYCVSATLGLAESEEEHRNVFGPVIARVDFILGELAKKLPSECARIRVEVDDYGELTPYWQAKLEMLQELNLI
ncbi:hypothetical protein [Chromobacterium violaceum]|uniref:hypothetical protein n=1 Tax=Chromobacterium violaceum TaxID=536 RepID=UPI0015FB8FD6|nr:hypothetical protein [Chromobacterium violaceum]MBA8735799.1 hypothetical protein [Chromobacterium violaceum]